MATVTIHQAKIHLSMLIARAEAGEEIIIARGKEPVGRLQPIVSRKAKRTPGRLAGKFNIPDEFFFGPLSDDELRLSEVGDEDASR